MKVGVIGAGYVGLVTGVVLADLGNRVVCVDRDPAKLNLINQGRSPIYEPGLEEILTRTLKSGRLATSDSIAQTTQSSDILFIAVGTPSLLDGSPDMSAVQAVATEIGQNINKKTLVVNKSTMPLGSAALVEDIILAQGADPGLVDVVSNPEFLKEGTALHDTLHPDRIVIGCRRPESAEPLKELYKPLNAKVIVTDPTSAELIKYASNSFLATKISFINAISRICELSGADVTAVAEGMGADKRIGSQFLQAGLGWGGSCFPKDIRALVAMSATMGYDFGLLKATEVVNEDQTSHLVRRLEAHLGGLEGKIVAILGLSFKPNTDDTRDSRSIELMNELLWLGTEVRAYDPVVQHQRSRRSALEAAEGAHAVILATEWNEFRQLDLSALARVMKGKTLCDGRRIYSQRQAAEAGLTLLSIGSV